MKSQEKFIFISGGTRGIGRAIAVSQAHAGVTFFLNYLRDDESAGKVKKELETKSAAVHLLPGNVGDPDTAASLMKKVSETTDRLDVLIHNAALGAFKPVHQLRVK